MKIIKTAQYERFNGSPLPPPENLTDNSDLIMKLNRAGDGLTSLANECRKLDNGEAHASQLMNAMNIIRTVATEINKIPSGYVDPHLIEQPNNVV